MRLVPPDVSLAAGCAAGIPSMSDQVVQKGEVDVRPVRKQDDSAFHVLRQLVRHRGIMGLAGLDADDRRMNDPTGSLVCILAAAFLLRYG